ncbi:hypothetical protein [Halogranum amylolyticum]|nr:hypothetical protein [Halogranum amylolyticum]
MLLGREAGVWMFAVVGGGLGRVRALVFVPRNVTLELETKFDAED